MFEEEAKRTRAALARRSRTAASVGEGKIALAVALGGGGCPGDPLHADAVSAPAGDEPDVCLHPQRSLHDGRRRPPVELARLARCRERGRAGANPDDL